MWGDGGAAATHVCCALASAAVSVLCVNPVDVVRTRLYNAPPGRYTGGAGRGGAAGGARGGARLL